MDKTCSNSTEEDSAPPNPNPNPNPNLNSNHLQYLNQLNKLSHKISKPPIRKPSSSSFDHQSILIDDNLHHHHQPPHQPPVYNINKSDFRDVVQKLTGSPAHDRLPAPPPIQPPKPPSSRLHRIRPPPLEHLSNRPPSLLNPNGERGGNSFFAGQPPVQPLSPLPPLPAVATASESPISAYMRYFQNSSSSAIDSDSKKLSGLSPMWTSFSQPPSPTSGSVPPLNFPAASSPVPFGCLPSPRSPYPLLSPGSLFSAVNQFGFQQFPLSPTSPSWKSH